MGQDDSILIDINSLSHTAGSMRQSLQTLLASVDAMTEAMDPGNPDNIRHSSAALRSIYRLIRISDNLSAFSLLEKGVYPLRKTPQSVFALLRKFIEQASELLSYRNITLKAELPERDFIGCVDEQLLRLVLWNLLSNAAANAADRTLTLRAERSGQDEVLLYLTNRAESPDLLETERLFDRYSRDPSDVHAKEGLGMGLRLCLEGASLHGGSLLLSCTKDGLVTTMLRLRAERDSGQQLRSPICIPEQTFNDGLIALSDVLPDQAFDPRDLL